MGRHTQRQLGPEVVMVTPSQEAVVVLPITTEKGLIGKSYRCKVRMLICRCRHLLFNYEQDIFCFVLILENHLVLITTVAVAGFPFS
jgi:hypothetical protein